MKQLLLNIFQQEPWLVPVVEHQVQSDPKAYPSKAAFIQGRIHPKVYSSKGVFRTLPYIQNGTFAKRFNGFKYFCKKSFILIVWLGFKYAAFYPRKSAKMRLLNKLSEILHKFVSIIFFRNRCCKGFFLEFSKSISNFKYHLVPTKEFHQEHSCADVLQNKGS